MNDARLKENLEMDSNISMNSNLFLVFCIQLVKKPSTSYCMYLGIRCRYNAFLGAITINFNSIFKYNQVL